MAKSTSTSATPKLRRKNKVISAAPNLLSNIIFIDPELRKAKDLERWQKDFLSYRASLCKTQTEIFDKALDVIISNPVTKQRFKRCPVIPFPIERIRQSQPATEA